MTNGTYEKLNLILWVEVKKILKVLISRTSKSLRKKLQCRAALVRFHDYPIFVTRSAIMIGVTTHETKPLPEYLYHVLKLKEDKVMQMAKDRSTAKPIGVLKLVIEVPSLPKQNPKLSKIEQKKLEEIKLKCESEAQ
eukprot:Awhi_evm1s15378